MKHFNLFFILVLFSNMVRAQVTNTRQGLWSDASAWNNNTIPGISDDVVLQFDVVIDISAYCRSLDLNGHNATVNSGVNLFISGFNDADTLLSRYIEIDTTTSPADTFKTIDFYYDSLKRNTYFIQRQFSSSGNISYQYALSFFYNGNSRLPFKVVSATGSEAFLTFENGKLVSDSSGDYVTRYTYLPGIIIKQNINHVTGDTSGYTAYVEYDAGGNIIHQADTSQFFGVEDFYYEFDGHPNPFNSTQMNCRRVLNLPETFIEESFAKSNMLHVNQYMNGGLNHYEAQYRYRYKANGYPTDIWYYDPADPFNTGQGKAVFIFTR